MYAYIRIHISYTTIYLQYIACFKVTISEELKSTYFNQPPFQGLRTLRRDGAAKVAAQRALENRFGGAGNG